MSFSFGFFFTFGEINDAKKYAQSYRKQQQKLVVWKKKVTFSVFVKLHRIE